MRFKRFAQQQLHDVRLKAQYLPESLSASLFNLQDNDGNTLALYESDYNKLKAYLIKQDLIIENATRAQLENAIAQSKVKVIKYFSQENLAPCELQAITTHFDSSGTIVTKGGVTLKKEGHQNCVVMVNDKYGKQHIYAHPKVRSVPGDVVGVSHSSLSQGNKVQFAGSFVHTTDKGWVIENTTGHFGTRPANMILFLETLKKQQHDLSQLTVKLWVPKDVKHPGVEEKDYTIHYENALTFLERTQKSKAAIDAVLPISRRPSISR